MKVSQDINILVVDDSDSMRRTTKAALQQLGLFNIEVAVDGLDAMQIIKQKQFGLIISDWNMPEMDGLEFLKKLRGNEATKTIPFLMVTSEAKRELVIEAISAGINEYIVKPINVATLAAKLENIF